MLSRRLTSRSLADTRRCRISPQVMMNAQTGNAFDSPVAKRRRLSARRRASSTTSSASNRRPTRRRAPPPSNATRSSAAPAAMPRTGFFVEKLVEGVSHRPPPMAEPGIVRLSTQSTSPASGWAATSSRRRKPDAASRPSSYIAQYFRDFSRWNARHEAVRKRWA